MPIYSGPSPIPSSLFRSLSHSGPYPSSLSLQVPIYRSAPAARGSHISAQACLSLCLGHIIRGHINSAARSGPEICARGGPHVGGSEAAPGLHRARATGPDARGTYLINKASIVSHCFIRINPRAGLPWPRSEAQTGRRK